MAALNRRFALFAATTILAAASLASGQVYKGCETGDSEAVRLTAEANRWLDNAGEAGLVLVKEEDGVGFEQRIGGFTSNFSSFEYSSEGYRVSFGLRGEGSAQNLTLDTLRSNFRYFVVDMLPLPGFEYIPGWDVSPRTPISSFSEGVDFLSFSNGRVRLRVRTSFYAIYGYNSLMNFPPIADAPARDGSYFTVEKSFPLDLTLTTSIS